MLDGVNRSRVVFHQMDELTGSEPGAFCCLGSPGGGMFVQGKQPEHQALGSRLSSQRTLSPSGVPGDLLALPGGAQRGGRLEKGQEEKRSIERRRKEPSERFSESFHTMLGYHGDGETPAGPKQAEVRQRFVFS